MIGNAGFRVATESAHIYIDAFYGAIAGVAAVSSLRLKDVPKADLVLVTHSHWDHFNAREVADVARRTAAVVVGPRTVVRELRSAVSPGALFELELARTRGRGNAASAKVELPAATVTAFRTFHSGDHNSYLVETPAFRFFHDGDNENTRRLDIRAIGRLDALLIGPWQGSGWVEFIEKLDPPRYFLMHMTDEELDEHDAGKFLPGICDRVPRGLVMLRPGQSFVIE